MLKEFDVENMVGFILRNTSDTKELIIAKGFSLSLDHADERIALLHTEVSELIDAFKKGKGKDAEAEELADIVIRLMNIPAMADDLAEYMSSHQFSDSVYYDGVNDTSVKMKWALTKEMHSLVAKLGDSFDEYILSKQKNILVHVRDIEVLHSMAKIIVQLLIKCVIFAEDILHGNLQEFVRKKMAINWDRPYRFNTSPELFNK